MGRFLAQNKRWWVVPILAVLLGLAALVVLSVSDVAPVLYESF